MSYSKSNFTIRSSAVLVSSITTFSRRIKTFCSSVVFDLRLKTEPISLKFQTYNNIVFPLGTLPYRPSAKCLRNSRCVARTDSKFKISFKSKAQDVHHYQPL